jgi:hypothetical protein
MSVGIPTLDVSPHSTPSAKDSKADGGGEHSDFCCLPGTGILGRHAPTTPYATIKHFMLGQ